MGSKILLVFSCLTAVAWGQPQGTQPSQPLALRIIKKLQTTLDPTNGQPQNVRVTVLTEMILTDATGQLQLETIASDGTATTGDLFPRLAYRTILREYSSKFQWLSSRRPTRLVLQSR